MGIEKDELTSLIGEWGRYQNVVFLLLSIPLMCMGYQTMMPVVILAIPEHRCRLPGVANDTYSVQSDVHGQLLDAAIPRTHADRHHSCRLFVHNHTHAAANVTTTTDLGMNVDVTSPSLINSTLVTAQTVPCHDWVYDTRDFDSTVITQFDLVCDQQQQRAHLSMAYLAGLVVGASICGFTCDWFGRKPTIFASMVLNIVFGMVGAFPPTAIVFIVSRFVLGVSGTGIYLSTFVLCTELVGPHRRNRAGFCVVAIWLIGPFLVGTLSYAIRDWQILQVLSFAPIVICLGFWWAVPESPRWLKSKGHTDRALDTVRRIARINRIRLPAGLVTWAEKTEDGPQRPSEGVLTLCKYPTLIVRYVIIFFNWTAVNMTYYGLSLNVGNLGGSVRVNFLLSSTVELVGYSTAWLLMDRLGRKRLYCSSMLMAGSACLATIFTVTFEAAPGWLTIALAMVGKLGVSAAFSTIYTMTAELYPTVIRNIGVGSSSTVGTVGSVLSPYIADLALYVEGGFGKALPLIVFGGVTVASGLLSLLLPETLGRKLPDTIEEALKISKRKKVNTDTIRMECLAQTNDSTKFETCEIENQ